jgi:glutamate dehydrogenase
VTSPTSERAQAGPEPDPDLAALAALYARQSPDMPPVPGGDLAYLREAARSHLRLAEQRPPGEPIIVVREPEAAEASGAGGVVEILTDDMPSLVESVLAGIVRAGAEVRRVVHPIVVVRRDPGGKLAEVLAGADAAAPPPGAQLESWIHADLDGRPPQGLADMLGAVLADVRDVVDDSGAMVAKAREVAEALPREPVGEDGTSPADVGDLLRWLADAHFTFLGYRYQPAAGGRDDGRVDPEPGLGLLRRHVGLASKFAPGTAAADAEPGPLLMTRATVPSPLRPVHPYYLAVRDTDGEGRVIGEHRFVGTLTVAAQHESVLDIPLVAGRVRKAIHRAGIPLDSYSGQQMLEVISALPREELFSAGVQRLHDTAVGVLAASGRRVVRLFLRRDPYKRFVSCLVYLPRDRYTTSSRLAMAKVLQTRLGGRAVD